MYGNKKEGPRIGSWGTPEVDWTLLQKLYTQNHIRYPITVKWKNNAECLTKNPVWLDFEKKNPVWQTRSKFFDVSTAKARVATDMLKVLSILSAAPVE